MLLVISLGSILKIVLDNIKVISLDLFQFIYLETTKEHGHYMFKFDWKRDSKKGIMKLVNNDIMKLYANCGKY